MESKPQLQEAQELFFRPLTRIVKGSGGSSITNYLPPLEVGIAVLPSNEACPGEKIIETLAVNPAVDGAGGATIHNAFSESVKVNPNIDGSGDKTVHNSVSESVAVNPNIDGSGDKTVHNSISESSTVALSPTTWKLAVYMNPNPNEFYPTQYNYSVNPAVGVYAESSGVSVVASADVPNFYAFVNWLVDGIANSGTFNALGTQNTYTFAAQTNGTTHSICAIFAYGWELNASASGPGSVSPSGTTIVAPGYSSQTFTATPNSGHSLSKWTFDGSTYSYSSSVNVGAQTPGTSHSLVAVFV